MPQQVLNSVENNFTKGLLTEFTGLNFPENAATATSNCVYTLVGDVVRREGFDYEVSAALNSIPSANQAIATYKWNNASGDGLTQFVVQQVGPTLYFYKSSAATITSPLSAQLLPITANSTVNITAAVPAGGTFDPTKECQFADGNGYLFVYHPNCDPFYCTYNSASSSIFSSVITVQIRDFIGLPEASLGVNVRPNILTGDHNYNLQNQGWLSGNNWFTTSINSFVPAIGSVSINVGAGLSIANGDVFTMSGTDVLHVSPTTNSNILFAVVATLTGTVTSYTGGTGAITLNITTVSLSNNSWNFPNYGGDGFSFYSSGIYFGINYPWQISSVNKGLINTWHTAEGNYPSNSDVWWFFKDSTGIFNPGTTQPSVSVSTSNAPQGHYVLNAFNQDRSTVSGIGGISLVSTLARPTTGTWFQGRVWYTGANASQVATGDVGQYSWTETIYFSQIVQSPSDFGLCYQQNDPTSQNLFDLLPTDGGTIQIQGSGAIYKLFALMNALLVFAANGVWYISGSTGIGFAANDYSIVKLSAVRSISSYSFVDVNGLPIFWNEEGIYMVEPAKQGQGLLNSPLHVNPLEVNPITVGTIQSFYDNIPSKSKQYARGVYDPINYIVQWIYKSNNEVSVTDRYNYDSLLAFNNYKKSFYPYSFDIVTNNPPAINSIVYVQSPGGLNTPESTIKYSVANSADSIITFAEERDPTFVDWATAGVSNNFVSSFTTGYKLHGQASRRFQIPYIYVYSRTNGQPTSYNINSSWDYPLNTNSGRISSQQFVTINNINIGMAFRRHRLRGWGIALQLNFSSVVGQPFDIMGWALYETANQGP